MALSPEGPSTHYFRTLVLEAIPSMVFGTGVFESWVLGPSRLDSLWGWKATV